MLEGVKVHTAELLQNLRPSLLLVIKTFEQKGCCKHEDRQHHTSVATDYLLGYKPWEQEIMDNNAEETQNITPSLA